MTESDKFVEYLVSHIGDAYVWGGQGELIPVYDDLKTRQFVEKRESKKENVNRCLAYIRAAKKRPLYAFDCSGLIINYLITHEFIDHDYTANGIYNGLCEKKSVQYVTTGDCVFKYSGGRVNHVGVYAGSGVVIEAKGRDYGVVSRTFNISEWDYAGTLRCFKNQTVLKITNPYMRGDGIRFLQTALNIFGYPAGEEDGIYGKNTEKALKDFIDHGIE